MTDVRLIGVSGAVGLTLSGGGGGLGAMLLLSDRGLIRAAAYLLPLALFLLVAFFVSRLPAALRDLAVVAAVAAFFVAFFLVAFLAPPVLPLARAVLFLTVATGSAGIATLAV